MGYSGLLVVLLFGKAIPFALKLTSPLNPSCGNTTPAPTGRIQGAPLRGCIKGAATLTDCIKGGATLTGCIKGAATLRGCKIGVALKSIAVIPPTPTPACSNLPPST